MPRCSFVLPVLLLAASAQGQGCAPLLPSGQPALMPFTPLCFGLLPPPVVWAGGNPGFALASFAPAPVPPGLPTVLTIGLPVPPPVPLGPPLAPGFGLPGLLTHAPLVVLPAGPSGPVPGPLVPLPIPATGGPLGLVLSVHTLVLLGPALALTGATGITI